MALVLNWFRCDFSPATLKLHVRDFASIDAAKTHRSTAADARRTYLWVANRRSPEPVPTQLVAVDGSQLVGGHFRDIDLARHSAVAKRIVSGGLSSYFAARRFLVEEDRFGGGISVLEAGTLASRFLRIRTGVRIKVDRPFHDGDFGLICQWAIRTEVEGTLEAQELAALAVGLPCLLELSGDSHDLPPEVADRNGKLLGTVESVDERDCVIKLRRGGRHGVPRRYIRLDPGPTIISRLDKQFANSATVRPAWQQMQRASLTLGKDNRRNPTVLKDRLAAIRRFLGGDAPSLLVVPLPGASGAKLTVDLQPAPVPPEAA